MFDPLMTSVTFTINSFSKQFKRLLNRELKDFSEATQSKELSMWVYNTFVGKHPLASLRNGSTVTDIIIHYVYDLRFDWLATCK